MKRIRVSAIAALVATIALAGCSRENIADNTVDAGVFVGKTAVKGVVGAGRLAARGTSAAVRKVRAGNAQGFPPGTYVCEMPDGELVAAAETDAGFVCPATVNP